ncbi:uncharacterized protein LOC116852871 isoform X2 [Odontomachus brunneus]|uniref:uncharacterized protein LOC116852871 isoform X2 n=1 Tax=Odontomachus brunneus TaxID=486640 RepID=UPI0013F1E283|nr:uncharacterized protein LOC116852871 isoform X2 [Odontomachus brunneus]
MEDSSLTGESCRQIFKYHLAWLLRGHSRCRRFWHTPEESRRLGATENICSWPNQGINVRRCTLVQARSTCILGASTTIGSRRKEGSDAYRKL